MGNFNAGAAYAAASFWFVQIGQESLTIIVFYQPSPKLFVIMFGSDFILVEFNIRGGGLT
ncbi:hypothetical protein [Paenibacillus tianmuensis]|uniref:hypothetical protein n=1 Tax=Paenibacillus tianmuensis TaxID=624147 RepID=UPI000B87440B|nr:hypothetical protein [Paenibacillus tianmuensis]